MIDRDEVLHVARLARLRLSDEEVERMTRELSNVLDYIEHIAELDLEGVPPTTHVVDVAGALRGDEPPGTRSRSHGFSDGPNAEFSVEEPIANSSWLVFASSGAPASARRATDVAVYGGR